MDIRKEVYSSLGKEDKEWIQDRYKREKEKEKYLLNKYGGNAKRLAKNKTI